jgi:hypothetical protein
MSFNGGADPSPRLSPSHPHRLQHEPHQSAPSGISAISEEHHMGDEVSDITTETIPDCLFARDRAAEEHGGYLLAGVIIVRRPKLKKKHERVIARLIQQLVAARSADPFLQYATCNLDGTPTHVGDKLQDDAWLQRHYDLPPGKCQRIMVRVDPHSKLDDPQNPGIRISDYDLKQLGIISTH